MTTKTRRVELYRKLVTITPNVYFQPPANVNIQYPCIVYHKQSLDDTHANDQSYVSRQRYSITVMDKDPDSVLAQSIKALFVKNIAIVNYATVSGLNHTYLELYY